MRFTARTATIVSCSLLENMRSPICLVIVVGTHKWSNIYMYLWIVFRHLKGFISFCQRAQHTDSCFIRFPEMLLNSTEISERFSLSNGCGGGSASYEAWTHASRSRERAVRESQKGQMVGQEDPGSTNWYPFEDFKRFFVNLVVEIYLLKGPFHKFSPSTVFRGWRFCTREAVRFWMWNEDNRPWLILHCTSCRWKYRIDAVLIMIRSWMPAWKLQAS